MQGKESHFFFCVSAHTCMQQHIPIMLMTQGIASTKSRFMRQLKDPKGIVNPMENQLVP